MAGWEVININEIKEVYDDYSGDKKLNFQCSLKIQELVTKNA